MDRSRCFVYLMQNLTNFQETVKTFSVKSFESGSGRLPLDDS